MEPIDMLSRMCKALDRQAVEVDEAEDWYEGEHPLPPPPPNTLAAHDGEARVAYQWMAKLAVMNFLPAVVDTPAEKLQVEGFRFSDEPLKMDSDAWAIWQRNFLDADSGLAIKTALTAGNAYALVWADMDGQAVITLEHPSQAIVWYEAGSRRRRLAGLKRWIDDEGFICATLYLTDRILKYRSPVPAEQMKNRDPNIPEWVPRAVPGEPWPLANPLGVVPLVELRVNASLEPSPFGGGEPEFEKQINDQRRINHTVLSMLVTMEHQAFRQRWVTGWAPPMLEDGVTPDKHALMKASAASMWIFDDPDTRVGDFSQADFAPFITAIDRDVKSIAASSGTPPYAFLLGDMINVAADSLARIEGRQVAKVRAHSRHLGEAFEEVIRLALKVEGSPKAGDMASSIIWADFEERTATELANLATTMKELGAPAAEYFAVLPGVDQQQAARWGAQRTALDLMIPPMP
jgi:hypothetical protein